MGTTKKPWPVKTIVGSFIVAFIVAVIGAVLSAPVVQNVRGEGYQLQNELVRAYNGSRSELKICLEQNPLVTDVTKPGEVSAKDSLTGMISQYPPNTTLEQGMMLEQIDDFFPLWDQAHQNQLEDTAVSCGNAFLDKHSDNQELARELDGWTKTGFPFVKNGIPDKQLVVIGPDGKKLHGHTALRFILNPKPLVS